jgi:hypothetical protein
MVKHDIKVIDGGVYLNGVHVYTPGYNGHAEAIASHLEHALTRGACVAKQEGWVVKNPAGYYLLDEGSLSVLAPGCFGDRKKAHVFQTRAQANEAKFGLLGPGRNAKAEKA